MAWTAPMTFSANTPLTAAQLNAQLRDNMNSTMVGIATEGSAFFVANDANGFAQRIPSMNKVLSAEATASVTYVDLTTVGPSVTVDMDTTAMVFVGARLTNDTANAQAVVSWKVSGDTTKAASDDNAFIMDGCGAGSVNQGGFWSMYTQATSGTNTFTAQYRAGGSGTASFSLRTLIVIPL